ncbi:MAG: flavin reductase [Alistipes sp.]|jgi:flavin reductase (DIM6/NTAB) family NADH-FMN oxidoreductase RutF|nr:flavin reductase [Alistipes sp.]MBQ5618003.1 flavin reductase [Alistipes sp.]MBQ5704962.1 flavin reductase [Alistipes sp.]MBQ5922858.1 flavin reductase [Alistipes sp.]MBQ6580702.1 flavin reductase [Alistipes sp.]
MNGFKEIDPALVTDNFIKNIGSDWMLITAGDHVAHNTMTASWGFAGYVWNKPAAVAMIRPQRYTYEFTEREDMMTLSFLPEEYREAMMYCGSRTGRGAEKIRAAGLSVAFTDHDVPAIAQARLVLECRKMYSGMLREENFVDKELVDRWYPDGDFHKMYVMEIVKAYIKE